MYSYLKNLENRLTNDQKDILNHIYAPTVVETPLSDSRRDICILPSGEIRSYGSLYVNRHMAQNGREPYFHKIITLSVPTPLINRIIIVRFTFKVNTI